MTGSGWRSHRPSGCRSVGRRSSMGTGSSSSRPPRQRRRGGGRSNERRRAGGSVGSAWRPDGSIGQTVPPITPAVPAGTARQPSAVLRIRGASPDPAIFVADPEDIREIRWHFVLDASAIVPLMSSGSEPGSTRRCAPSCRHRRLDRLARGAANKPGRTRRTGGTGKRVPGP
jgi:hypothetical protein